jgi:glyoxalase family protein
VTVDGIHHVTAMASDPGGAVRFYRDVLGLRFVKRTVNFDEPGTYHLYFGDARGSPGTVLSLFPYPDGPAGEAGAGQVTGTALRVPEGSLDYWADRLDAHDVAREQPVEAFGRRMLGFEDDDGLWYELVEGEEPDGVDPWDGPVPEEFAIRGIFGVLLTLVEPGPTAGVLDLLGYERAGEDGDRTRYQVPGGGPGDVVDVRAGGEDSAMGVGCVHHVAFRVPDGEAQADWQQTLVERGHRVTRVQDRHYFESVYFREPGGVLLELATDGPGFDRDEDATSLGERLQLPPRLEDDREDVEAALPPLDVD